MTLSIEPSTTQAILIGTSEFEQKDKLLSLPAVENNLYELQRLLADSKVIGIPDKNITVIVNALSADTEILPKLIDIVPKAIDTLIIYYAGHGIIGNDQKLYLATKNTIHKMPQFSGALPFSKIPDIVKQKARAKNIIVILDCCFSGRAIAEFQPKALKPIYILTAVSSNEVAEAPVGATYTAFTGELVLLLNKGVDNGKKLLTLEKIEEHLKKRLTGKEFKPKSVSYEGSHKLAIAYNRAYCYLDKLDFSKKQHLINLLLRCPSIKGVEERKSLVEELPFANAIKYNDIPKFHVNSIINASMDRDNGFEQLLDILRCFDGETKQFQVLIKFIEKSYFKIEPERNIPENGVDSVPKIKSENNELPFSGRKYIPQNGAVPNNELPFDGRKDISPNAGINYAVFFYVVGYADEIRDVKRNVSAYSNDEQEWWCWKPFEKAVTYIAQEITAKKELSYEKLSVTENNLISMLEETERANKIVIIIVDPWSLQLSKYLGIMEKYGKCDFFNCEVLFVCDSNDKELTKAKQSELRGKLTQILFAKTRKIPDFFLKREVKSANTFRCKLSSVLQKVRQDIIDYYGEVKREVKSHKKMPTINNL